MVLQEGSVGNGFNISLEWGGRERKPLIYEVLVLTHFSSAFLFLKKIPYFLL